MFLYSSVNIPMWFAISLLVVAFADAQGNNHRNNQIPLNNIKNVSDLFNVSPILSTCKDAKAYNESELNKILHSPFFLDYDAMVYIIRSNKTYSINETKEVAQRMVEGDMWSVVAEFGQQYWAYKCNAINKVLSQFAVKIHLPGDSTAERLINRINSRSLSIYQVNDLKDSLRKSLNEFPGHPVLRKMEQFIAGAREVFDQQQAALHSEESHYPTQSQDSNPSSSTAVEQPPEPTQQIIPVPAMLKGIYSPFPGRGLKSLLSAHN